ncbi:MAG TPA: DUF2226 domain-containing protein [Methanothermococcus okinawensis]|uniref:DUF2226 domain-containing protein n=1 Tax=Methanothermococcus okinawensis TaxID=155863 RepID=A0A832YRF8_9EURY|nr:DUF2226 domain-containing protein [Methanothermococcus okinawensis]
MVEILEDKPYQKNISDINLKDILKKLNKGCIYFIYKYEGDTKEDVHIFIVKDGNILSNIYTDGKSWGVYGDAEVAYEILHDNNKRTLVYIIKNEKIIGQLYISKDSIKVIGDTETHGILGRNVCIIADYCPELCNTDSSKKIRYVVRLNKSNIRKFKGYLEENKYYLVNIRQSILKINRKGYVVYKGKIPIMAAYEDNYGVLFGDISCNKIKKLLKGNISTVEIYEYSDDFIKSLLDKYPEMKIDVNNIDKVEKDATKGTKKVSNIGKYATGKLKTHNNEELLHSGEPSVLSREELLKRFGLKDPDEEWVEKVIETAIKPTFEEILHLKKEIEYDIAKKLKSNKDIKNFELCLELSWEGGLYYINGEIKINRKKLLGFVPKNINVSTIRYEIDKILKKHIVNYSSGIFIKLE